MTHGGFFAKWSLPVGTLFGIPMRAHALNILWIGLILYESRGGTSIHRLTAICISIVLTLILHELGHAVVARRLGSIVKGIILMLPLGALAIIHLESNRPLVRLAITISGPLINLLTALSIYLMMGSLYFLTCSHYMKSILHTLFVINLTIGIFNLIPLYPMDGGRMLNDILLLCRARHKTAAIATIVVSSIGFISLVLFSIREANVCLFLTALFLMTLCVSEFWVQTPRTKRRIEAG